MSPRQTKTSPKCVEAAGPLWLYAQRVGGKAFGPDAGFAVGPGERLKRLDAAWASPETIASVPPEDQEGFWPVSPDVAVEIKSHTDAFRDTVAKVELYRERGSKYALAISSGGFSI